MALSNLGRKLPALAPEALATQASSATFTPSSGTLTALGDASGNSLEFSRDAAGNLQVNGGAVPVKGGTATAANTLLIQAFGLGGNDTLTLNEANGALPRANLFGGTGDDTLTGGSGGDQLSGQAGKDSLFGKGGADSLFGGAGDDVLAGGGGNDQMFGADGNDQMVWNPGDGSDTVEGQAGFDTLRFNSANLGENIDISANSSRVLLARNVGNVAMDLGGMEQIDLRPLGGADDIAVGALAGTGLQRVNIDLGGSNGGGDAAADTVTVGATQGADIFAVTGNAGGIQVSGLAAAIDLASQELANDRLVLNGQGGDDSINASGLGADGIQLTMNGGLGADLLTGSLGKDFINGGDGNDVALMGQGDDTFVWNPGDDSDTLEGQAGIDTLLFNNANVTENIDISANGGRVLLARNIGNVAMDLGGMEQIDLRPLGGADNITVGALDGTGLQRVNIDLGADGAADVVTINATSADDIITIVGDGANVSVLGLSAEVNITRFDVGVDRLVINALGGDDVVSASNLSAGSMKFKTDGGSGDDVLIGGDGDDTLIGGEGDDVLIGGPGLDILDGGPGANSIVQGDSAIPGAAGRVASDVDGPGISLLGVGAAELF